MSVQAGGEVPVPQQFMQTLWGRTPAGLVQTCEITAKGAQSALWNSPAGTSVLEGRTDVYTAVALARRDWREKNPGYKRMRPKAKDAVAIPGLWIDFDVAGGPQAHASGKTPIATLDDAVRLACAFEVPTVIVGSGYGLHAWWLFTDGPWYFQSYDDQDLAAVMAAQWFQLHRRQAAEQGWSIDAAHDLARLMRLPGTINGKGGRQAPVTLLSHDGARHRRAYLQMLCAKAGPVDITPPSKQTDSAIRPSGVVLGNDAVDILLESDPKLHAAFFAVKGEAGEVHDHSMSARDLSLCSRVVIARANAGMETPNELLEGLIAAHRLHHDPQDRKHLRGSYLSKTIEKARRHEQRTTAAAAAANLAALARTARAA